MLIDIWGTDTFVKFERKNCSFEVKDGCLTVKIAYWVGDGEGGETEGEAEVTLGVEETEIVTIMLAEDAVKRGKNKVDWGLR